MKTAREYIESMRELKPEVYMFGRKINNIVDDPIIRPAMNAMAMTYRLAEEPEHADIMTTTSTLTGEKINRFLSLHQNPMDLVKKNRMQRLCGQRTGCCFQRCGGHDATNSVFSITYEIDQKYGTEYHSRFKKLLEYMHREDLVFDAAMTDPKGDRSLRPSQQVDPDLYLHIVERRTDGIVVRGAKVSQTGLVNSHEVMVMPTRTVREDEKDYAVAFSVPANTKGLFFIYGRQSSDTRKLEGAEMDLGNYYFGGQEAVAIFDNVFVPNERVFMCGETEFAFPIVERFANLHRQSYGGCKSGMGDVLIGATAAIAEYNGIADAAHVRDKLVEMTFLNETVYACGLASAYEGYVTPAGNYITNTMLANVTKLHVTRNPYEICRHAQDIAGGAVVTLPSQKDLEDPKIGKYIEKYFKGVAGIPTEHRFRMIRLIECMTLGLTGVGYTTESLHGAGSPQAQRIMIERMADLENKKQLAQKLCGVKSGALDF